MPKNHRNRRNPALMSTRELEDAIEETMALCPDECEYADELHEAYDELDRHDPHDPHD